jgi:hypothetical protein
LSSPQGAVQWQKTVPYIAFKSFLQTSDGDFILTGGSTAFGASSGTALVIIRLGPDGKCKWQKTYGDGEGRVIKQTSDGGYIARVSLGLCLRLDSQTDGADHAVAETARGSSMQ